VTYHRPETTAEALQAKQDHRHSVYLSGGTEILTRARERRLKPGALVDLMGIPELRELKSGNRGQRFGATLRLNELAEQKSYPLLARACGGIADHTVRNSITLGGNIAGKLPYREALLPFLLVETTVHLESPAGPREVPLREIFSKRLHLQADELILALSVPSRLPDRWFYSRHTADSRVDYPLMTLCAVRDRDGVRCALGGFAPYPLVLDQVGTVREGLDTLGAQAVTDLRGSGEYRVALLEMTLDQALQELMQ
jgi:xanthine dehydrogenase molybdenum-binding subunit